ncbi:MAG: aminotransferase class V-fold PLP-dependent enzyme [Planctomycetes bacterium]|nr:aminotransferase class V-fold PLP-dependent enzyme [Planctomycetota bacterium]
MGIYERLGVRPLINAKGTFTMLSGSLMPPEVVAAMAEAARRYVNVAELEQRVGERLAELTGAGLGLVTAGAAAAITQCTAACMIGKDAAARRRLPDVAGLAKTEVITQKQHRNVYDQAVTMVGAKLIEVDGRAELEAAIRPGTAMLFYVQAFDPQSRVSLAEMIALGRARGVPVFVDAAAELPPADNLTKFIRMGADLVTFSGGKGLKGPQASGLLLGRKDLVEAAALNGCPNHGIGRPMKAGKEEIVGLLTAVELYVQRDHAADWARWEAQIAHVADVLSDVPHVKTGQVPKECINHIPRLYVQFDSERIRKTQQDVMRELQEGSPRIEVLETEKGVTISPNTLESGEEQVVARRLREILKS